MAERFRRDETVVTGPLAADRVLVRVPVVRDGATDWNDVVEPFETAPEPVPDPVPGEVLRAVEAMSPGAHEHAMTAIDECGRMLGGWIRDSDEREAL